MTDEYVEFKNKNKYPIHVAGFYRDRGARVLKNGDEPEKVEKSDYTMLTVWIDADKEKQKDILDQLKSPYKIVCNWGSYSDLKTNGDPVTDDSKVIFEAVHCD
ncbi:hypothetical protein MmiEs2_01600 [Methanimicrococcus stummii]|uniref:Uncharacterized protein n=1 Tax=Methanimicrococcus stummii TaxID=3028294 RepID=A0AA96ZWH1_9EURY|nr:hypothetical protein [Methanimicrococcus sp. Es2]WNY27980.1 hypothetical protein MmiEs2_01600 [Methanimicrococcus sp. Es2]